MLSASAPVRATAEVLKEQRRHGIENQQHENVETERPVIVPARGTRF